MVMARQEYHKTEKTRKSRAAADGFDSGRTAIASLSRSASMQTHADNSLFQLLIDAFPDIVLLLRPDGRIIACNRAASLRLKRRAAKSKGTIFEIFHHPSSRIWKKKFNECRAAGRPLRFEKEYEGKFYSHYIYPVTGEGEALDCLVVFVQDVTDYHLTVNALSSSEEKYKQLLENISDVIYSANEDGVIIYINRAVENFLGYTEEEVKGGAFEDFLHPDDVQLVLNDVEGFLSGTARQKEYRFLHKEGGQRWGRVSSHPVFFKGTVIGYQGVITDITQVKSFNIGLIQAAQEHIIWSLASSFAGEIDGPIREARNLLLRHPSLKKLVDAGDQQLRKMMHDLERISVYIKNYLIISESALRESREIHVNTLIENSLALVKKQYEKLGISLEWLPGRDLSPVIINPHVFIQIFLNLFSHSLESFSRNSVSQKSIHISTHMEKESVIIRFMDNSRGISDELLAHISDPYYTAAGRENAIGLSVAVNLVEDNQGTLTIRRGDDQNGLDIRITLPALIEQL